KGYQAEDPGDQPDGWPRVLVPKSDDPRFFALPAADRPRFIRIPGRDDFIMGGFGRDGMEYGLRLMSPVKAVSDIPAGGKNLVIVAAVDDMLHFRVFDADGKVIVDADE